MVLFKLATEHILYFDGKTGYKIAQYYEGARNADAKNPQEMAACMEMLRKLHHSGVTVPHTFRIRERIDFYERICRGHEEMLFEDYPAHAQTEYLEAEYKRQQRLSEQEAFSTETSSSFRKTCSSYESPYQELTERYVEGILLSCGAQRSTMTCQDGMVPFMSRLLTQNRRRIEYSAVIP